MSTGPVARAIAEALHAEGACNHRAGVVPRSLATCPNRAGWLESASDLLADIRPLIEAEVREQVAREIEHSTCEGCGRPGDECQTTHNERACNEGSQMNAYYARIARGGAR